MGEDSGLRDTNHALESLMAAARRGGEVLARSFGQVVQVEEHAHPGDVTTSADKESQGAILRVIDRELPGVTIISEELGRVEKNSDYVVVIDPLDGSNNFMLGVPSFTVSIALMHRGEVVMGVVYQPILKRIYHALKGGGAFLDGASIRVNRQEDVNQATVSYVCGYGHLADQSERIDHDMNVAGVKRQIRFWSPAYDFCLLASGKIEGVINGGNELYDYAAGKLLVREAGGRITDWCGNPDADENSSFVASNGTALHRKLLDFVRENGS